MKPKFGREIALLSLPVVIIVAVTLWRARGGSLSALRGAPSDLEVGPPRLEIGKWEDAELLPAEVARGIVVRKIVSVWQGGQFPPIEGADSRGDAYNRLEKGVLVFRRGSKWEKLKPDGKDFSIITRGNTTRFGNFSLRRDVDIRLDLDRVPRDADKVRLRGHFIHENYFKSSSCAAMGRDARWRALAPGSFFHYPLQAIRGDN